MEVQNLFLFDLPSSATPAQIYEMLLTYDGHKKVLASEVTRSAHLYVADRDRAIQVNNAFRTIINQFNNFLNHILKGTKAKRFYLEAF